jgi:hypothetical protein
MLRAVLVRKWCGQVHAATCWCPPSTSVLTCRLLKRKPSPQCAWLLFPQLSATVNTKHGVTYTNRKCQRCGTGVDNEHHLVMLRHGAALA